MEDDDCFVELFKLQKMFETSFSINSQGGGSSIKSVYHNQTVSINILFKPTDPDFDKSVLSKADGIDINLKLHRISPEKGTDSPEKSQEEPMKSQNGSHSGESLTHPRTHEGVETYYEIRELGDIKVNDPALSDVFKKSIQKVLIDFTTRNRKNRKYVIYEALKFLDKNLVKIYEIAQSLKTGTASGQAQEKSSSPKEAGSKPPDPSPRTENPWTLEEQKWYFRFNSNLFSLEDGLVRSKGISDPREKWLLISKLVKTRTPEECRRRFLRCREVLVKKQKPPEPPEPETPPYSLDKTGPLAFSSLEMTKLSLGKIGAFSMDIVCLRCSFRLEVTLAETTEKTAVCTKTCEKCSVQIRCEFTPSLFFPAQLTLGRLSLLNSDFVDFNHGEFKLTCEECETQSKIREVKIGDKKSLVCRGCFNKFLFGFEGVVFGLEPEPSREIVVKRVVKHEPRKAPQPKGIKVGTPLPANGTCKHYKKSFRWFRFPCCGRLFPCDICHDDVSDHKCGHANFIVCGYCSTQQPSSNKVCKFCSKGCTASSSAHWEGGKGCRDGTKLSRKDSKKYKLMNKSNTKK